MLAELAVVLGYFGLAPVKFSACNRTYKTKQNTRCNLQSEVCVGILFSCYTKPIRH